MKSKKRIRSIAWLISFCLLMTGFSTRAEELPSDVGAVKSDMEGTGEEGVLPDTETVQDEEGAGAETVQSEGASSAAETEREEEWAVNLEAMPAEKSRAALAGENSVDGLSLSVEYPSQIKCGEPTIFRLKADGGSDNYKYRIHSILDSKLVSVYDVSWGDNSAYQESNVFEFTFYASGTYYIRFSALDSTTYDSVSTGLYEHTLNIQDSDFPSVEQIVNDVAAQCLTECSTDFEKALWLHDWILDNADYDSSYSYCSAEGVLARKKGTCDSYHRAYEMLLNKVGIETGRIEGNGHVWTAVKMDGKWYQVDTTWDDMGASLKGTYYEHVYFGITDSIIGLVHSDHKAAVPGYESTSLENNYFIKTGKIRDWSDSLTVTIREKIAAGETEFALPITDPMPDNYKNVIYNLAAYQLSKDKWGDNISLSASYSSEDKQLVCIVSNTTKPITKVSLSRSQLTLTEGDKGTLTAAIEPADTTENRTLSWSSSNPKIATVSNGTVTGVSAGEATITVKTVNGKSAGCKITVTRKAKPITKVSLNKSQLTLTEGVKGTLTATIEPADTTESKTLSWSTSNGKVATVSNGTVTAVSAGEATITVKTVNGKSASCKITVTRKAKPITKVSLNKSQLTLTEGGKETLTAAIEPADTTESKALSWSTSNGKVATVSNGTVTAVSAGEATITVKTVNGKSAACRITVTKKAKPISKVSLNKSQLTLTEGQNSTLTATIEPTDTTESKTLSWSSSNAKIATVASGTVRAVSAGEATITAKAANGKSAVCKVKVIKNETSTPNPPANTGTETQKPKPETPAPPADTGTDNQNPDNTPPRIFPDVNSGDWYEESAGFVSSRRIMTGMSDGRFGPGEKLSRAQFATILHRMAGTPAPAYNMGSFPDVPEGQFYTEASVWAREAEVISGYNDGRFGPSDNITREQMAVMMFRYANMLQLDVSERGNLGDFPDASKVSGFAWDALEWAVGKGLITGDQGRVNPRGTADRAQCATIIMRFMNAYGL